ncbi:hypothetical protein [Paenibacillus sp. BK720]|uniref:hypothetical protein n=1 Tax=Paenibacillus sp. BK720 TaxID=2587092 RepID=UPI0014219D03|nr:hypothetical protein [Paenibacillus sp. BK720]NIK67903.1 hypothetical protein [Paenibacillus sp. BK720]
MNQEQIAQRNKQRERQQRGTDFQDEMRRSWAYVSNCWRLRIKDGGGETRPGDELTLLPGVNILAEHKRTAGQRFQLSFLRADQVTGLLDFDRVIEKNLGLVFVSFHNPEKGLDEAYAIRLVTALRYMQRQGVEYINRQDLARKALPCARLTRRQDTVNPAYDLQELIECYKSL